MWKGPISWLQTLELRLDQAHKDKLGHLEFLELMLEHKILQRRQPGPFSGKIASAREFGFDQPAVFGQGVSQNKVHRDRAPRGHAMTQAESADIEDEEFSRGSLKQ